MKLKRSKKKIISSKSTKKELAKESHSPDFDGSKWRVLLVDDEPDIHELTRIGLRKFTYDGKSLELISAYSSKQAREILQTNQDFALAMIDVVMESDESGLDLVRYIREELKLSHIRLIIRTGQPGKAPEQFVIDNFDIDDYKEKTELTNLKMKTMFLSSIKSYRDILTVERNRKELDQKVKERTRELDETNKELEAMVNSLQKALAEVNQLKGLLPICSYCKKIRDDTGYWNQIESYILEHSEATFSHGICQECLKKYYPELNQDDGDET